jgi:hypothetical protein
MNRPHQHSMPLCWRSGGSRGKARSVTGDTTTYHDSRTLFCMPHSALHDPATGIAKSTPVRAVQALSIRSRLQRFAFPTWSSLPRRQRRPSFELADIHGAIVNPTSGRPKNAAFSLLTSKRDRRRQAPRMNIFLRNFVRSFSVCFFKRALGPR